MTRDQDRDDGAMTPPYRWDSDDRRTSHRRAECDRGSPDREPPCSPAAISDRDTSEPCQRPCSAVSPRTSLPPPCSAVIYLSYSCSAPDSVDMRSVRTILPTFHDYN